MASTPREAAETSPHKPTGELASRWARLAARIIDLLIALAVVVPAALIGFLVAGIAYSPPGVPVIALENLFIVGPIALAAFLVVSVVQLYLLGTRGQTAGRIVMKVRVVDARTGEHPGWARLVLLRAILQVLIVGALNSIALLNPIAGISMGAIYAIIDSLFVFRQDRRTIHDHYSGTRVDKVAD